MPRRSTEQAREDLHARLHARRAEVEEAVRARVFDVSDPLEALDPDYAEGLRVAVGAAIDYGLTAIELGGECLPPPPVLLTQARIAARSGVSLDTVLRRYIAGHALLVAFLIEEAKSAGVGFGTLQRLLQAQAAILDRLLAAVSEQYTQESEGHLTSSEQRTSEQVERLLAGETPDTSQLAYDFKGHHLGVIAAGPGASEAIRALAAPLDRRLLLVHRSDGVVWAWLGGRRPIGAPELQHAGLTLPPQVSLAHGEPTRGLGGWRLTHQQARAALSIALRSPESITRYADVALLASIFHDDLLVTSLHELYLAPLQRERDGGKVARETLRAYYATERNVSSAAVILGVSRRTVASRLHAIEVQLGCPLRARAAEIETALRLHDLDRVPTEPNGAT